MARDVAQIRTVFSLRSTGATYTLAGFFTSRSESSHHRITPPRGGPMSQWSKEDEAGIIAEVRRRSAVDPDFRKLALADPAAAIAKISTKGAPTHVTFRFVDNSGGVKTVPLPDPIPETDELSDAELENVAGGSGFE